MQSASDYCKHESRLARQRRAGPGRLATSEQIAASRIMTFGEDVPSM